MEKEQFEISIVSDMRLQIYRDLKFFILSQVLKDQI